VNLVFVAVEQVASAVHFAVDIDCVHSDDVADGTVVVSEPDLAPVGSAAAVVEPVDVHVVLLQRGTAVWLASLEHIGGVPDVAGHVLPVVADAYADAEILPVHFDHQFQRDEQFHRRQPEGRSSHPGTSSWDRW